MYGLIRPDMNVDRLGYPGLLCDEANRQGGVRRRVVEPGTMRVHDR
jgi:hypothetical protein